ncbi:hypothetical protein PHYBOEH_007373 [Phytophthora boehmeriae]|uniref:ELP1 first N-terminal beta-propeller domain-containing protein n=1 Tax=Phytophthora boehmeriae TaxID=109152 RepID=A0A8T1W8Y5_9STRA|nr:hypothetical protein PHYBOEH_007373 [Phytophthora boehmeriae]
MRNLVALLRRVWALEAESSPSDRCVAFASISGEAQSFFLRESGRIEMLQPQTEDLQASSLDLQLFLDLREFVEPSGTDEDSAGCWKWMNYVAELGMLVCASTSGALVTVDVDAIDGEEVGAVDVGLRALAWSGNQEMLALVTGTGRLLVMSNDWEVLHETEIESCLPSDVMLSHSTKDDEHWRCELCWREDSQFVALNIATKAKPKGETQVGNDVAVQKVLVFTAQLEFHALGRLEDGRAITKLGSALDWSQSMSLIASCETRRSRLFVVFFERNGLRHGEFEIPSVYRPPAYRVGSLRWNVSSDILAVSLLPTSIGEENGDVRQSVVQLWTRNNYHWYLKQELRLGVENQLVDFAWDEEAAGRPNARNCNYNIRLNQPKVD